jgi:hypothetical protein
MTDHDRDALVDPARFACLGNGYHAAVLIEPDGGTALWVLSPDRTDHGEGHQVPAHERLGRLPAHVRARLNPCQATTKAGTQCTRPVEPPEPYCPQHRGR